MHTLTHRLLPLASLLTSAATLLAADAPVELKPRWEAGKRYHQTIKTDQQTTMNMGGQSMKQGSITTMEMVTTVSAQPGGKGKRLQMMYGRMAMEMDMNGQKLGFDSAKPNAPDPLGMGQSLGKLTGKEFAVVVDEKDQVVEVENMEKLIGEALAGNPMGQQLRGMFNKETMANMIRQSVLYATPGKPVKAGDSWPFTITVDLPQMGRVAMVGNYTMKGMAQRGGVQTAELTVDGKLSLDISGLKTGNAEADAAMKQMGMKMEGGAMKGTIWFDPALGMNREALLNQDMTMSMKNPTKPEESMTIPIKQTITQTLTKVEDVK